MNDCSGVAATGTSPAPAKRTAILVLGMHRSGTSALTGVLSLLGASAPQAVIGATPDNEKGHWEPERLVLFHDKVLLPALSSRWDDWREFNIDELSAEQKEAARQHIANVVLEEYGDAQLFVVKDPRICRFVPFYASILTGLGIEPRYILPLRNPLAVTSSLGVRDSMTSAFAALLWLRHTLDAEYATRGSPRAFVCFEDLAADWRSIAGTLEEQLHLTWPRPAADAASDIEAFLKGDLQHHAHSLQELADRADIPSWIEKAYSALLSLKAESENSAALFALDEIRAEFNAGASVFGASTFPEMASRTSPFQAEAPEPIDQLGARIARLNALLAKKEAMLAASFADAERLKEAVARAEQILEVHEQELSRLRAEASTYGAQIGRQLSRLRRRVAPSGSWRLRPVGILLKGLEKFHRLGFHAAARASLLRPRFRQAVGKIGAQDMPSVNAAVPAEFDAWIRSSEPSPQSLAVQRDKQVERDEPMISVILPVYKVHQDVLTATIRSLLQQTYRNWEACIAYADIDNDGNRKLLEALAATDERLRIVCLEKNLGISGNSNAALQIARGEFIALLDHDDELTPWALFEMAAAIKQDAEIDFLYSDKDCIDEAGSTRLHPLMKPKWSPEILYSVNYLTHLNVMRRSLVEDIGGWRRETDGAQDWDLFFRVTERARKIVRVPSIHYHWRLLRSSTSMGLAAKPYAVAAQLRTVEDRVKRLGLPAHVVAHEESGFRLHWEPPKNPDVDIVIRGKPRGKWFTRLLRDDPLACSSWVASLHIVLRDGDGEFDPSIIAGSRLNVQIHRPSSANDETSLLSEAAAAGSGNAIVFIDSDVQKLSDGWLRELAGWILGTDEIGFVGSLLLNEQNEVIEAGRVLGSHGVSAPLFHKSDLHKCGPFGGPLWFRNVSAVGPHAAACRRRLWLAAGSEGSQLPWPDAFIARCAAIGKLGARGMVNPHARAIRNFTASDSDYFWSDTYRDDPYFHPAFRSVSPLKMMGSSA